MNIDFGHIISFVSVKLIRIPLAIAIMVLIARSIGPSGAGLWAMYMAAGGLFSSLFLNWSQSGLVRFGREEWITHQSCSRTLAVRKALIFIGLGISSLILLMQPWNFLEIFYHLPGECWIEVFVLTVILWLQAETQSIYRITGQFKRQLFVQLAADVIVVIYLWLFLKFRVPESPHQLIVGLIFVLCSCWVVIWIVALIQIPSINFFDGQDLQKLRTKLVSYSWPIIPGIVFVYMSNWGNHVLIYSFSTSQEVGYFDVAYQVTIAFFSIASPLSILYLPHLLDMKLRNENAELIFFNRTVPTLVVLWIAGAVISLTFLPCLFLTIFGPLYTPAITILNVLCASIPGSAILALYAIRFELNNKMGQSTIYSGMMIAVNLLIAWLLAPHLKGVGVAISISLSYVVLQFLYLIAFHGFFKLWNAKIFYMFIFATVFGIMQAIVGASSFERFSLGLSTMLLLAFVAYTFRILDLAVIREMLPRLIFKCK